MSTGEPKDVVPVLPTETTILDLDVTNDRLLAIQLEPVASGQVLTARLKIALDLAATPADVACPEFLEPVPFGSSRIALIQIGAAKRVLIVGEYDGAGGDVDVYVRRP